MMKSVTVNTKRGILLALAAVGALMCVLLLPATADATPSVNRYEQTNENIDYAGNWSEFNRAAASAGSYDRSSSSNASATIYFTGSRLDYIAMTGSTPGIVDVYLDDVFQTSVDLYSASVRYQVVAWSSGEIAHGAHKVEFRRSTSSLATEFLVLDAVDIWGTIESGGSVPDPPNRYEQIDIRIVRTGSWSNFSKTEASGGSYGRSKSSNASATVHFTGTRLDYVVMTGSTPGIVDIYLDDDHRATVDLYSSSARYKVVAWSSGELSNGAHKVEFRRSTSSLSTEFLVLDAVDIWGTIQSAPDAPVAKPVKATWLGGYLTGLTSRLAPHAAYICEQAVTYNVPVPVALSFFKDENGWWRESYCTQFPRSWNNRNIGNLTFASWQAARYPGTVLESGYSSNVFSVFPSVENGIEAWFYLMRVRNSTFSAGIDQILAGDIEGGFETIITRYAPDANIPARVSSAATYYRAISAQIADEYGYVGDPDPPNRYEQTHEDIDYTGSWSKYNKTEAYGGSYGRSSSSNASATIHFTGTRLDYIAMTGTTPGIVDIYLDDVFKTSVDLYSASPQYKVVAWSSGEIANGAHKVEFRRSTSSLPTEFLVLDAVRIWGTITG